MKAYEEAEEGEWWQPRMKNFRLGCCDCSLIHRMNIRILKDGKGIEWQFFRDEKETKSQRALVARKAKKK